MKQKHRIFSMLLSLCMLASLLSGMTINASATRRMKRCIPLLPMKEA